MAAPGAYGCVMNKATALFAITTTGLAIISLHLARSLHLERARVATLTATSRSATAAVSEAQQQTDSSVDASHAAAATTGPTGPKAPTAKGSGPSTAATKDGLPPRVRNRTYREAELAHRRLELLKQYPDLIAALNLQPDEAERFLDLLARQQVDDLMDELEANRTKSYDEQDRRRERESRRLANSAQQAAFLGEARTADWNRYLNSLAGRAEVRELRTMLIDSDYPLRRDQYEPLVELLATEQVRHKGEREQLYRGERNAADPTHEEVIVYMGKRLDLIEESLQRRRLAAQSVLDNEQLRRYQAMLDLERARAQAEYDSSVTLNAEAARKNSTVRR
jgi:hypothetical protein